MKIAILGEALIDFKSTGPLAFQGFVGGSSLNVATACARLGQHTTFLTQISTDIFGQSLRNHMTRNDIDTRYLMVSVAQTTLAFVEERRGQPQFSFMNYGAADTLYDPLPRPVLPSSVKFMQFGSISLLAEPCLSSITDIVKRHLYSLHHNITMVFDPNCRPALIPDPEGYKRKLSGWLRMAHLVKVSDQDLAWLEPGRAASEIANEWLAQGPKAVVVTQGEKGSTLYRNNHGPLHATTPSVAVIDTVGAGDTYTAGLMVGLLEHGHDHPEDLEGCSDKTWLEVMHFAAASAAINCSRAGANPPTRAEVSIFRR